MSRLPTWLRAATITAAQTFAGAALIALVAFLGQTVLWINGNGDPPDVVTFGRLAAVAALTAASGFVTAVVRRIKPPEQTYQ